MIPCASHPDRPATVYLTGYAPHTTRGGIIIGDRARFLATQHPDAARCGECAVAAQVILVQVAEMEAAA